MSDEKDRMRAITRRSPSYPQYGLKRCLDMVQGIYQGAHTAEIANEAIVSLMGFQSVSGPATAAIAALKQFGLIEGRDPKLRITELSLRILEPENEKEKREAIAQAARTPQTYSDLFREFGERIPAENVVRSIAVRRFGFSGSGAEKFVSEFLATCEFLRATVGKTTTNLQISNDEECTDATTESCLQEPEISQPQSIVIQPQLGQPEVPIVDEKLEFRLSPNSRAIVLFSGRVNKQAIAKLRSILEVIGDTYPDE